MQTLIIRRPDDFHVHFRQGDMLLHVASETADVFARAMVMPNTDPAIANGDDVDRYRREIRRALEGKLLGNPDFCPLMTFKITPLTTAEDVLSAQQYNAVAGKLYPDGVTTGSEGGVRDFKALYPIFELMSKQRLVLSIHGELPDAFCLDREEQFLEVLDEIINDFPDLRIVMEHLSTEAAVTAVREWPDTVAATITVHHLELTLDDLAGGHLNPHYFCKPLVKYPHDRDALLAAALSGNPKFFLGTDSAPHAVNKKECACGCAGVYTAPVAMPVLAEIFEKNDALDKLEAYTSQYGAEFYGLSLNDGTITLVKEDWVVEQTHPELVPYKIGQALHWKVQR